MAKNTYKSNTFKKNEKTEEKKPKFNSSFAFFNDRRLHLTIGFFLLAASLFLFTAFLSYLFTGKADMSVLQAVADTGVKASGAEIENWLGLIGAQASFLFVFKWFGLSFIFNSTLSFHTWLPHYVSQSYYFAY